MCKEDESGNSIWPELKRRKTGGGKVMRKLFWKCRCEEKNVDEADMRKCLGSIIKGNCNQLNAEWFKN